MLPLLSLVAACRSPELVVEPSDVAPGVQYVSWTGDEDFEVEVDGRTFQPGDDGRAAVLGFRQGSELLATVSSGGRARATEVLRVPARAEPWEVRVLDPARSALASGVMVLGLIDRGGNVPAVTVVDGATGGLVWWHDLGPAWEISTVERTAGGGGLVWSENDTERASMDARLVALSLDGREHLAVDTPGAHHVALEAESGRYAWLEFDVRDGPVASDLVVESGADGSDREVLLTAFDDLFGGVNDFPCAHMRPEDLFGYQDLAQWSHGNSLALLPGGDAYLVNLRWVDAVVRVSRAGGVDWVLSGPWSDFTAPDGEPLWTDQDDARLWSHGHFSDAWADGMLMFDNGNHRDTARVVEVAWDEASRTAWETWSHLAPDGAPHVALGDARRLPNGNVLISWTVLSLVQEVTRGGDVVWELEADPSVWTSRVLFAERIEDL